MNVTIISCFDVYDNRVELLRKSFCAWGYQVTVLIPNFRHMEKCTRGQCPEGFEMLPVVPYYSKFSPARIWSHLLFQGCNGAGAESPAGYAVGAGAAELPGKRGGAV